METIIGVLHKAVTLLPLKQEHGLEAGQGRHRNNLTLKIRRSCDGAFVARSNLGNGEDKPTVFIEDAKKKKRTCIHILIYICM